MVACPENLRNNKNTLAIGADAAVVEVAVATE
jgi:hypothetical protein